MSAGEESGPCDVAELGTSSMEHHATVQRDVAQLIGALCVPSLSHSKTAVSAHPLLTS